MSDVDVGPDERTLQGLVLGVLGVVVVGSAVDLWLDGPENWRSTHMMMELTLMLVSTSVGIVLWRAWRRTSVQLASTQRSLATEQAEREQWRQRAEGALSGMAQAINEQFDRWALTPSERQVALLLLKGHGHKQIAGQTNRSERTVRQHAVAVYSKSGQAGRAELAGFFLEGIPDPAANAVQ